jgi:hypothetical protein
MIGKAYVKSGTGYVSSLNLSRVSDGDLNSVQ